MEELEEEEEEEEELGVMDMDMEWEEEEEEEGEEEDESNAVNESNLRGRGRGWNGNHQKCQCNHGHGDQRPENMAGASVGVMVARVTNITIVTIQTRPPVAQTLSQPLASLRPPLNITHTHTNNTMIGAGPNANRNCARRRRAEKIIAAEQLPQLKPAETESLNPRASDKAQDETLQKLLVQQHLAWYYLQFTI
eukprot:scaffold363_cov216-Skeletonema_marinoi.AAC.11